MMENKKLTYTMRALSLWNLVQLMLSIILIGLCILSALNYIINKGSFWLVIPILFVWPIARMTYLIGNRYIRVEEDRLIFNVEQAQTSLMSLPKFYKETILLKDIDFYGVFTDIYVKNVKLANRKKGHKEPFDIVTVKEGDIEVPVGLIKFGNPLAFVTRQKDSYVYEDNIFTPTQIAHLFYCIEHNSGKKATGFIEGNPSKNMAGKSIASFIAIMVVVVLFGFVSLYAPAIQMLWNKEYVFTFMNYTQLETIYIMFLIFGHIALAVVAYAKKILMRTNAVAADVAAITAAATMSVFYGIAIILFVISVL